MSYNLPVCKVTRYISDANLFTCLLQFVVIHEVVCSVKLNYILSDLEMLGHYLHYRFSFYKGHRKIFFAEHQFRGSLNKRIRSSAFKQSINFVWKRACKGIHFAGSYTLIPKQWKYMRYKYLYYMACNKKRICGILSEKETNFCYTITVKH